MRRLLFALLLVLVAPSAYAQTAVPTAMADALSAFRALSQGDWTLAEAFATKALNAGTLATGDQAAVYGYRGDARRHQDKHQDAIDDYSTAISIGLPAQFAARVFNARGLSLVEVNEMALALQDYTHAIQLDATFAEAFNNRGSVYLLLDDYDRALADHTQAIRLNPDNNRAFNNRGQVYLRLRFWEEAVDDFTTAINLAPSQREAVIALFNRGRAWEGLGEDDEARADFELAHELAPDDPDYREKYIEYGFIRP